MTRIVTPIRPQPGDDLHRRFIRETDTRGRDGTGDDAVGERDGRVGAE